MSDDNESRREAEARLAEAKAQLAAAEEAYRQVVPCEHRTMTIANGEEFSCADCGTELPDPRGCQHHRIDNLTWQCRACGEKMLPVRHQKVETVLSAPNAAACTNPECSGDITDPACTNPHGLYVPDRSKERRVPIMTHYSYTCQRCRHDGTVLESGHLPIWDCGHDHRGDTIPIRTTEGAQA